MSWNVSAVGKAAAVAIEVERQFAKVHCSEPEQSIAMLARAAIVTALAAWAGDTPVKVAAAGSQGMCHDDGGSTKAANELSVSIVPLWGFVG